jgi:preprotein translocase subunit SecB
MVLFNIELVYAGVFRLADAPQDMAQQILLIECPRMLFPFARYIIANAIRDGGFPPLMIDPVDFAALYRDRFQQAQAPQ